MVFSAKSASTIFMVVLFIAAPALCQLEGSVNIEQEGGKEPFEVGRSVDYNISLTNSMSSPMHYTVELEVGSDTTDFSISTKRTKEFNLNAKSSDVVQFPVNFMSLSRGEFGKWVGDKNDTSTWERAWFRAVITPLIGDQVILEDYSCPGLIKVFMEFRNAEVSPRMGTDQDQYDYSLDVFSTSNDTIKLQAGPSPNGPWTDLGEKEYNTPGLWQTLIWSNNTLDFDFSMAYYRFLGRKQSQVYEGPFWPVVINVTDNKVDPGKGFSNTQFSYELMVCATKSIDVGLNVLDINSNRFELAGRVNYGNVSNWEILEWKGIQPSRIAGSEGSSFYYFTFYYPGSSTPFGTTYDMEGSYYRGPEIVLLKFENATVTPSTGSALVPYTYCVEVNTPLPVCDVELYTSTPGSPIWKSQGTVTYEGKDKSLCWNNVELDADEEGVAKYRFIRVESITEECTGPNIMPFFIEGNVTPIKGVAQIFPEMNDQYTFTYTVSLENGIEEGELWVELLVRAPNSTWKTVGERKQYDRSNGHISWNVKPFSDIEDLGTAEYKFNVNGVERAVFEGPELLAMYKGLDFEEAGGGKYNYIVWVKGITDLKVDLLYSSDNENWIPVGKKKSYSAGTDWKQFIWENEPAYIFYEVDIEFEERGDI
jgi:hypothetical protein